MDEDETPSDLELLRRDYTSILKDSCAIVVDAAQNAAGALPRWPQEPDVQPVLDRALVRMALAEGMATRLILPQPDAMEYFGLPRSATASALDPDPAVRVQDPERETWDFRPWLSEKLTRLREHLYVLMQAVESGCSLSAGSHLVIEPGAASLEEQQEWARDRAIYELRAASRYAQEILSAIANMGLVVVDWRLSAP